mmetsp:Transcript_21539/g.63118  ORF Transcript_21539/g.63118 Transcript_21539/m.63118 type:complete len:169 (-) Transcript_21539:349-855(-)
MSGRFRPCLSATSRTNIFKSGPWLGASRSFELWLSLMFSKILSKTQLNGTGGCAGPGLAERDEVRPEAGTWPTGKSTEEKQLAPFADQIQETSTGHLLGEYGCTMEGRRLWGGEQQTRMPPSGLSWTHTLQKRTRTRGNRSPERSEEQASGKEKLSEGGWLLTTPSYS